MFCLTAEDSFDAAHFLSGYEGKCSNLHGHRWRVLVELQGEQLEEQGQQRGMLVDFSCLKEQVKQLTAPFDHSFIYEEGSLKQTTISTLQEEDFLLNAVPFRPTAENFSKYFFDEMKKKGFAVSKVTVYETPNNCASYKENA